MIIPLIRQLIYLGHEKATPFLLAQTIGTTMLVINRHYDNWEMYAAGYKLAGDILVQHIIDKRVDRDTLVFPIVFNYRQYLELRCKEIILMGRILADEKAEFPPTHNLHALWTLSRSIIADGEPSADESDLEAIDGQSLSFAPLTSNPTASDIPSIVKERVQSLKNSMSLICVSCGIA